MGVVIQLFGRGEERPPAVEQSQFMADFIDNYWGDFITSVAAMSEFESEEKTRGWMADLREQIGEWPDDG